MLFEKIESKGLAQYSYLIGDGMDAVVIDPRRDCDVYVDLARQSGMSIVAIFETHRHEDFVSGSVILSAKTGAKIWHADPQLAYHYGEAAEPGQTWTIGSLSLKALHTPGHTEGSRSYVLYEPGGAAYMVFTGDVLFTGEVGRTDFLGMDRAPEMASQLYDSIHHQILPLGDGVILCPAHGYGSACGSTIADRPLSTLGLEKRLNARLLSLDRTMFIESVARELPKPLYFEKMERWNLLGAPQIRENAGLQALSPQMFNDVMRAQPNAVVLDLCGMSAYMGGHVHGALGIPLDSIPSYIGWYVDPDTPLLLITGQNIDPKDASLYLQRQGYDTIIGYLAGGMDAWLMDNMPVTATKWLTVEEVRVMPAGSQTLLDVRTESETLTGKIPGAIVMPHKTLLGSYGDIPQDRPVVSYCISGPRSAVAASVLEQKGYTNLGVLRGGILAWREKQFDTE